MMLYATQKLHAVVRFSNRKRIAIGAMILLCGVALTTVFVDAGAAPKLSKGNAKNLIRRFAGGDLGGDNVQIIGEVSTLGSSATAVAQVQTAFRFAREEDKWRVAEVRVGDGQWENVRLIENALDEQKRLRAEAEIELINVALENYRRERGFYVVAENERVLIDHLAPRFLARVIRVDPWNRPYNYQGTMNSYVLSSDGADGVAGTADDIVKQT